jgi:hypothetical protein
MPHYQKSIKKLGLSVSLLLLTIVLQPAGYAQSDAEIAGVVRVCQQLTDNAERLACYDRILPPAADETNTSNNRNNSQASSAPRATPAPPVSSAIEAEEEDEGRISIPFISRDVDDQFMTEIVEIDSNGMRNARIIAADRTVYVMRNSFTVIRWPDTPFMIEVQRGTFGTVYLWLEESRQRVRVSIEE